MAARLGDFFAVSLPQSKGCKLRHTMKSPKKFQNTVDFQDTRRNVTTPNQAEQLTASGIKTLKSSSTCATVCDSKCYKRQRLLGCVYSCSCCAYTYRHYLLGGQRGPGPFNLWIIMKTSAFSSNDNQGLCQLFLTVSWDLCA